MIYKIKKELFLKNKDYYFKELKRIDFYKKFLNLLVEDLTTEEISEISNSTYFNPDIIIYKKAIIVDEKTNFIDCFDYIINCDINSKQEFIDLMYKQRIIHFSGKLPLSNQIVSILENGDILNSTNVKIGDLKNGIDLKKLEFKNLLTLKGKYFTDLNPLYDFSKINADIPNCIDIDEFNKKTELLNKVSKEVKEVNQEQLIYLCELMTNVENKQEQFNQIFQKILELKVDDK